MGRRRQDMSALAAALGLHLALLGFLWFTRAGSVSKLGATEPLRSDVSWEVELAEASESEPAREPARETPSAEEAVAARFAPQSKARRTASERTEPEREQIEPEVETLVEGAANAEPEAEPAQGTAHAAPIDLGLGSEGWQRWVRAPKEGDATSARVPPRTNRFLLPRAQPKSTTGGLQEGLEERDRALGLGPEGRVLSALHKAAHAGIAPDLGVARFEVTVHRSGTVEVTLGTVSGHEEQWKKVAAYVARDLRAKRPRIPLSREGVKLVVELVAERTLPNGTKASELEDPHLDVPALRFQSTEEAKEQLKQENPTTETPTADNLAIKLDSPGVYIAERGTVCSYKLGVGSIAPGYRLGAAAGPMMQGACDPSHVGAKPQRTVRARVVEQSMF